MVEFIQQNRPCRQIVYNLGHQRARQVVPMIESYLERSDRILDFGAGTCNIYEILDQKGYTVVPVDVKDLSFVDGVAPVILHGDRVPFKDDEFDVSLILAVLHHTPEPEKILREAIRVSRHIIVLEDIYTSWIERSLTYLADSLLNLEFRGHPHTNRTDEGWKETFARLGLALKDAQYKRHYLVFRVAVYYLVKN